MGTGNGETRLSRRRFLGVATCLGAGLAGTVLPSCGEESGAEAGACPDATTPDADQGAAASPDARAEHDAVGCPDTAPRVSGEAWDEEAEVVVVGGGGAGLACSIELWNAGAAAGEDLQFRKQAGLQPVDTPPYRATALRFAGVGSVGGLRIDSDARVLDVEGRSIPRLYGAGMVAGGFIGPIYPGSGTAIASTLVFGRIAGANAARGA